MLDDGNMPLLSRVRIVIMHYRMDKKYFSKKLSREFPNKGQARDWLDKAMQTFFPAARVKGSGQNREEMGKML